MRRSDIALLIILLFASLVAACGPKDSPDKAAAEWTKAIMNPDSNRLAEITCIVQRANVQSATFDIIQLSRQFAAQHAQADLSDLLFDTISKSSDKAQVRVHGRVRSVAPAQSVQVDIVYAMVRENEKWKWCGEINVTRVATPASTPGLVVQPIAVSTEEPKLIAFNYLLQNAQDGWADGHVSLAFENVSDAMISSSSTTSMAWKYYDLKDTFVETQEGKTYPAIVTCSSSPALNGMIDLRQVTGIPPGFRVLGGMAYSGNPFWGDCYIQFRAAQAAHPTAINFTSKPEWTINLAEVTNLDSLSPTDLPASNFEPVTALSGTIVLDEPGKLLVTLGKCNSGNFTYTAVNRDQLDQASASVQFLPVHAMFSSTGYILYFDAVEQQVSIGPGQTRQGEFYAFDPRNATHMVLYWSDGKYDIYTTESCEQ